MDYYNEVFTDIEQLPLVWADHEFEQCTFKKLDLSRAVLAKANLINCRFEDSKLTQVDLTQAKLNDVKFINCQLPQVDFSVCNSFGFGVAFDGCQLDYAVFLNLKLKKTSFIDCSMKEVHFVACDLTGSGFKNCNLELAKFDNNNLSQVDFSTSYHVSLDPAENKVKKARFSVHNLPGLLTKYDLVIRE
ncbi:pentapeptide repeat-containing protein [Spirosoma soli]|uniref:Pentapeptide repeat-containing protein n=1 Tax=Spirosoma soli TaxID=1770529 RepID=A0ABW5LXH5_9BACT